jgi:hypothetical protein
LSLKSVLQFRSIHQSDLTALKINAELPSEGLLPQFPLIKKDLALAFQLPFQVLFNDVPYGKIIQAPFLAKPLEMLPGPTGTFTNLKREKIKFIQSIETSFVISNQTCFNAISIVFRNIDQLTAQSQGTQLQTILNTA